MTDFSSDATRRARRNLLAVSVTLLLFRGFDSQVGVIAGIKVNATALGISWVLAIGVIYFFIAHFLYWRTDLAAMRSALLGKVLTDADKTHNRLWKIHNAFEKWAGNTKDAAYYEQFVERLNNFLPVIEEVHKEIDQLHNEARLNSRLIRARYYLWDFGFSFAVATLSISTAFGWVELNKLFLWAGWALCE